MTRLRERGISRETRIAFLATRSVTCGRVYTRVYMVDILLKRLDKLRERAATCNKNKKEEACISYLPLNTFACCRPRGPFDSALPIRSIENKDTCIFMRDAGACVDSDSGGSLLSPFLPVYVNNSFFGFAQIFQQQPA